MAHSRKVDPPVRVAVVGAGPAGLYAAEALLCQEEMPVEVDLIDRLPAPYGLVRYGVAPDHPTIKSVVSTLDAILHAPGLRFVGGVEVGASISRSDLRTCYDAVIYATGAASDRRLGIPGENLPGSLSATDLVSWYNGHPDARTLSLDAKSVAVIGAGNVALDIARVLTSPYGRLATTDIPSAVLPIFATTPVREVHVVARRGPEHAKFSTKELRELEQLSAVSRHLDPQFLRGVEDAFLDRRATTNLALFRSWSEQDRDHTTGRRLHFRFWEQPVEILGTDRVEGIRLERTDAAGGRTCTTLPVQMVVRAVGYRSLGIPDLPFDGSAGLVPNAGGRVVSAAGDILPGEYVAGWVKRGPSGVIGTNKVCARETVTGLVDDWKAGTFTPDARRPSLDAVLGDRQVAATDLAGWQAIDREEARRGEAELRARSKISDWPTLRQLAGAARAGASAEND